LAAALPADSDGPAAPVDVGKFELSDLAGTQPEPGQQHKHGPISQAESVFGAGADHSFDIFRGEESRD
jgi:hypothetical protein